MTETATTIKKSSRVASVRASFDQSRAALQNRGNLLTLILSSLLLLVLAFSAYFTADLFAFVLDTWTPLGDACCNAVFYAVLALGALLAVAPLLFGWLRLALLMAKGETPFTREMLYYTQTPRRYRRALFFALLVALCVALPLALVGGVLYGASLIANEVQVSTLAAEVAARRIGVLYALATLIALPLLALEGFVLPVVALGIKQENLTPFAAVLTGLRLGARHFGTNWCFIWSMLWRAALSLCTLGILWLAWHAPLSAVAYLCYVDDME